MLTGFLICAHRWNHTETGPPTDAWHHWNRRADLLVPPGTEIDTFSTSRLFAATYPEAVSIAELIGSLRWRRLAAGGPGDQRPFTAEIGRRLGLRDYSPAVIEDPITHWIEQDSWQPPSLPGNGYRSLKTFGGATFRKPSKDSDTKRRISAYWFGVHHRGGDAMLHHRTLNPVVVRDWSPRMELFSSAVALTATTSSESRKHLDIKPMADLARTEWARPQPVPSPYLDSATEPVGWPQRSGPRPPTGSRPQLPSERPRRDFPANPLRPARQSAQPGW